MLVFTGVSLVEMIQFDYPVFQGWNRQIWRQITAPLLASSTSPNVPSPRNEALSKGLKKPLVSLKALGGGNSNIFYFHPYLGKIPILTNIFQMG